MKLFLKFVLVFLAASLVAELLLRQFVTAPSNQIFDPQIGYRYQPGSEIFDGAEGFAHNRLNSLGLNAAEIDTTKPRRALLLGDSYTESRQVERARNFMSVASAALPDWDIVNGGRDGLNIVNTIVVAERLARLAHFDRIVLVTSNADYVDDLLDPAVLVTRRPDGRPEIRMVVESREQLKQAFEKIVHHSALAVQLIRQCKPMILEVQSTVLGWRTHRWFARDAVAAAPVAPVAASAAGDAEAARDALRAERLRLVIAQLRQIAPVSVVYIHQLEFRSAHEAVPGAIPARSEAALRAILEPLGVPFASTGPALAASYRRTGEAPFGFNATQPGIGHLNTAGHQVIGRVLADLIGSVKATSAP